MRKITLLAFIIILQTSCSSSKGSMIGWVGESKQKLIKTYGSPIRVLDNDEKGEILVYAEQVFTESDSDGPKMAGPNYWTYEYVYVDEAGKIVSYRNEKQNYPPQAIDSQKMAGLNLLTSR
jgi:hypothetical protein